jgi:magnesium chelatase family protein
LPDCALHQSRDRCKAAISNSGQQWPIALLTINRSPATLAKAGSHYDLAVGQAVLVRAAPICIQPGFPRVASHL